MKSIAAIYITLILMAATCNQSPQAQHTVGYYSQGYAVPYLLDKPDKLIELPHSLKEISGLTYSTELNILYCINDEEGYIYALSVDSGQVIDKVGFGKRDDYESIAYQDGIIYVAESNGNVKVVSESNYKKIAEYDDILSHANDIEGATYDPSTGHLLLAAKGNSKTKGNNRGRKAVFSMNIDNGAVSDSPTLSINAMAALEMLLHDDPTSNTEIDMNKTSRVRDFAPSGIAIHPFTKEIYLISARGKLMLVSTPNGDIKAITFLDQDSNTQPEGICFSPDGTLYISNEGKYNSGTISVFSYHDAGAK